MLNFPQCLKKLPYEVLDTMDTFTENIWNDRDLENALSRILGYTHALYNLGHINAAESYEVLNYFQNRATRMYKEGR